MCAWLQVYQEYMVVPSLSLVPALARVLTHCAASDPAYKVIVFFPTARFTGCVPWNRPLAPPPCEILCVSPIRVRPWLPLLRLRWSTCIVGSPVVSVVVLLCRRNVSDA